MFSNIYVTLKLPWDTPMSCPFCISVSWENIHTSILLSVWSQPGCMSVICVFLVSGSCGAPYTPTGQHSCAYEGFSGFWGNPWWAPSGCCDPNVQVVTEASSQIRGSEARAWCWLLSLGSSHCLTLHVSPWFSFLQDTEDFDFRLGWEWSQLERVFGMWIPEASLFVAWHRSSWHALYCSSQDFLGLWWGP